jgi:molybdopterin-guanine dinucleotide biosynthesis protein A
MGLPKLSLPFGAESMLQRVVRLLRQAVDDVVVASGPGQELPELLPEVRVVRDCREGRGPLEGLYAGLCGLPLQADAAYVTGCDVPLLVPAFVVRMIELLGDRAIAVPVSDGFHFPLAAVYRRSVVGPVERLLAADRLRPAMLFDLVPTRRVAAVELTDVDPELATLRNVNCPAEYFAALARAGLEPSPEVLAAFARIAAGGC